MKRYLFAMLFLALWHPLAYGGEVDWAALNPEIANAIYVGSSEKCLECHEEYMNVFKRTAHARASHTMKQNDCESCHGPMSKHLDAPKRRPPLTVSFKKERGLTAVQKNSVCLQCHEKGKVAMWMGSQHERVNVACADCHNIQKGMPRDIIKQTNTDLCIKCHTQYRAVIQKSSHHPLREGKLFCTDCHNPHGTMTEKLVSANSVNEKCYECHAEYRGPFLFEHPVVRENCITCHDPHSSNFGFLLRKKPPHLCQQCHVNIINAHSAFLYDGSDLPGGANFQNSVGGKRVVQKGCPNCHSQIHGSNHPAGAKFQR